MENELKRKRIRDGFEHEIFIDLPSSIDNWQSLQPLHRDLYISSIGFFPEAKFHYCERTNGSPQPILIYCIKGSGYIDVDGVKQQLKPNQLLIIPPNTPHCYYAALADPWSIYWSQFDGLLCFDYIHLIQPELRPVSIIDQQQEVMIRFFGEMIELLSAGFSKEHLLHAANLHKALFSLIHHRSYNHAASRSAHIDYIGLAIDYIRSNINKAITVEDMAASTGLSVSYFKQLFKVKTGLTPIAYVNHQKIQQACERLTITDLPVKTIAADLGFNDPYYFSRRFKKIMSKSPKIYRKESQR